MSEDIIMKMYVITHPLAERLANWGQKNLACNFTRRRQSHIFIWCNLIYYYTDSPISQMVVEAASLLVLSDGYDSVMPLDPFKKRKLLFSRTRLYNFLLSLQYQYSILTISLTLSILPHLPSGEYIFRSSLDGCLELLWALVTWINRSLGGFLKRKANNLRLPGNTLLLEIRLMFHIKKSVLPCSGESHYNEYRFLLLFLTFTPCFPQPPISCCRYRVNNSLTLYIPTS